MDSADKASAVAQESIDYAEAERDNRELNEIEAAIGRLERGDYGVCMDCEQAIPFTRLRANPAALRCADCQEVLELRLKTGTVQQPPSERP